MSPPLYRFCDICLASDLSLEIPGSDCVRPDWTLTRAARSEPPGDSLPPFMTHRTPGGEPWLLLARVEARYCLHFPGLADFWIDPDAAAITYTPTADTPPHTLTHLVLDQVLPRVLSHRGDPVLHASAIGVAGRAIAFIGEAGWGKSTLTASLGQAGYPVLTDDCLLLRETGEAWLATGSYPGLRLWPDSLASLRYDTAAPVAHYTRKGRMGAEDAGIAFRADALPLARVFLLAAHADERILIERLSARESIIRLLESTFRLDITDPARNAREFDTLARLAAALPVHRLTYPRRYARLPAVRAAIMGHLVDGRP